MSALCKARPMQSVLPCATSERLRKLLSFSPEQDKIFSTPASSKAASVSCRGTLPFSAEQMHTTSVAPLVIAGTARANSEAAETWDGKTIKTACTGLRRNSMCPLSNTACRVEEESTASGGYASYKAAMEVFRMERPRAPTDSYALPSVESSSRCSSQNNSSSDKKSDIFTPICPQRNGPPNI